MIINLLKRNFILLLMIFLSGCSPSKRILADPLSSFYRKSMKIPVTSIRIVGEDKGDSMEHIFVCEKLKQWARDGFSENEEKSDSLLISVSVDKKKSSRHSGSSFSKSTDNIYKIDVKISFRRLNTYGSTTDSFVIKEYCEVVLSNMNHEVEVSEINKAIMEMIQRIDDKTIKMMEDLGWI